jgi:hypothetical protein
MQAPIQDVFARPARQRATFAAATQDPAASVTTSAADHTAHSHTPANRDRAAYAQVGHQRPIAQQTAGQPSNQLRSAGQNVVQQTVHDEPVTGNYKRVGAQPNDFFKNPFAAGPRIAGQPVAAQPVTSKPVEARTKTIQPSGEPSSRIALQPPRNEPLRQAPRPQLALLPSPQDSGGMQLPQRADIAPPPTNEGPGNALRDVLPGGSASSPQQPPATASSKAAGTMELPPGVPDSLPGSTAEPLAPAETLPEPRIVPGSEPGDSLRGLLNDPKEQIQPRDPSAGDARDTRSPSDQSGLPGQRFDESPFDQERANRDAVDRLRPGADESDQPVIMPPRDTAMIKPNDLSCEEFRDRIARETIYRVSLDPSPPFRPDLFDAKDYERQFEKFESRQELRPWRNADGQVIATGKMIKLAYEQVMIETANGTKVELPMDRLGEGDLAYVSENWGLPKKCLIEQVAFTPRAWTPLTMTWKASNLCSKPRYFEEVNLERYGHTAGPWLQPVVSSAHFFVNVAVVPYKMGIHPPTECHYALGYYRPGNCAPWIVPPVPISARGALTQAAVMTGAFWLIP